MRILLVGAGGVGSAFTAIAARRDFFELCVVSDYDRARARTRSRRSATTGSWRRRSTPRRRRGDRAGAASTGSPTCMNAVDPRFVMPIFEGAFAGRRRLPRHGDAPVAPAPGRAVRRTGVKLGDEQFAEAERLGGRGAAGARRDRRRARACPTSSRATPPTTCSPRSTSSASATAPTSIVDGYDFAPSFSIWTTIEECLNPPVIWEKDRGWFTTAPFSEPEVFDFPEGIGPVECVNVEHEEVLLMPRWVDCKRVTFKYGLGDEFIEVLKTLHKLGLDRTDKVRGRRGARCRRATSWPPACPTRPTLGDAMRGKTCAGLWVTGTGKDGAAARDVPLPRGRQRVVDGGVRPPVRGLADRDQPGGRAGAARDRHLVGHTACSARRPSTPCRSSTCSRRTARRGASGTTRSLRAWTDAAWSWWPCSS